jgi:ATP-dependent RNA helicase
VKPGAASAGSESVLIFVERWWRDDLPPQSADMQQSFLDFGLKPAVQCGLLRCSFFIPSGIQAKALPFIIKEENIILQDHSGSGKTTLLAIAVNHVVNPAENCLQAVLLSPTKELAQQTAVLIERIGSKYVCLRCSVCHGAVQVKGAAHVWSGTPGKILQQFSNTGTMSANTVRLLVIDEIDEMLSAGLEKQVSRICRIMPETCQVVVVSATASMSGMESLHDFLRRDMHFITTGSTEAYWHAGIQHYRVEVPEEKWKLSAVFDIFSRYLVRSQCIIFTNESKKADWLEKKISLRGFEVQGIHGGKPQDKRVAAIDKFRSGTTNVLVATDVASRGLDIPGVVLVINFDVPLKPSIYVHRVGRCGRFGRRGIGITIITKENKLQLQQIEQFLKIRIRSLPAELVEKNPL